MAATEVDRSLEKIAAETTVSRLLNVTCSELAALFDASLGDLLAALESGVPRA
jgi:hypothetical protein